MSADHQQFAGCKHAPAATPWLWCWPCIDEAHGGEIARLQTEVRRLEENVTAITEKAMRYDSECGELQARATQAEQAVADARDALLECKRFMLVAGWAFGRPVKGDPLYEKLDAALARLTPAAGGTQEE